MMRLTLALRRAEQIAGTRIATIFGERRRTWREVVDRMARLASVLRSRGLEPGGRVAMLSHSSDRYVEFYFAAIWAGGIAVPLPTRATEAEIAFVVADSGARILLVGDGFTDVAADLARTGAVDAVIFAGDGAGPEGTVEYEAALATAEPAEDAGRGGDDVAALIYTGGTTGRPKGVMLTHTNIVSNSFGSIVHTGLAEGIVGLHAGPLYHAAAGSRVFTNTLLAGTHVVIPRFEVGAVLEAIARHRVTMTTLVPTMLTLLLNHPDLGRHDLSSLELVGYGGAPMPPATLEGLMRRLPRVAFAQAYGMTELSPACTYLEPRHHRIDPDRSPDDARRLASAGRAIAGVDVRVVGPDDRELPRGEIGEIVVRGPTVMKGYWNQPALTAEALRGGAMHTGDLGSMDEDGFLFVVDRLKDMIVSGGENVYCVEVENAILTHPAVRECAVIGIPDPLWGEAVHAVVVRKAGAAIDGDEVVTHCRERIAAFKCPRSVAFREAMPLSAANKILKSELRRPFWADRARAVA